MSQKLISKMLSGKVVYSDKAVRMKPKSDRMGYSFIAKSKAGRPSKQRLSVLVSFTTAAYVNATGKEYSRCLYHNNSTAFFFWPANMPSSLMRMLCNQYASLPRMSVCNMSPLNFIL